MTANEKNYIKVIKNAEAAYKTWSEGKYIDNIDQDIQDAAIAAIERGTLRWTLGDDGKLYPITDEKDARYNKAYSSPREAVHFITGEEPTRTEYGKIAGATFAPITQHRLEGDKPFTEQRSKILDYGQDLSRLGFKYGLPVLGLASRLPMIGPVGTLAGMGLGAGSSLLGSVGNDAVSWARNDPYGDDISQGLATAAATGLGIGLARRYLPRNQDARWIDEQLALKERGLGLPLGPSIQEKVKSALLKGENEIPTYGDWVREPVLDPATGPDKTPGYIEKQVYPREGYFDKKTGKFVGSKIIKRDPTTTETVETSRTVDKNTIPNKGPQSVTVQTASKTGPKKQVRAETTTYRNAGKSKVKETVTETKQIARHITDDQAKDWLIRSGYPASKEYVAEAKQLLEAGWLNPNSELGTTYWPQGARQSNLTKQDLVRTLHSPQNDLEYDIYARHSRLRDPKQDAAWQKARTEYGRRMQTLSKASGASKNTQVIKPEQYAKQQARIGRKIKAGSGIVGGFLLPIGTELLWNPIKRRIKGE